MDFIGSLTPDPDADVGRRAFELRRMIAGLQESFSVAEKCRQPVIAAVHSACIGGAIDLMCACDIRMCTSDAWFSIKVRPCFHLSFIWYSDSKINPYISYIYII